MGNRHLSTSARVFLALAASTASTAFTAASAQTTWYVDLNQAGPGSGSLADPYTSIQYALDQATTLSGDTVAVAPGIYVEDITFPQEEVDLISLEGPHVTEIHAVAAGSVTIEFNYKNHVEGFTLEGNMIGGIGANVEEFQGGSLSFCIVQNYDVGCENLFDLDIDSCDIVSNRIGINHFGGGLGNFAFTTVADTILWRNIADIDGVFISNGGSMWITNTIQGVNPRFMSETDRHLKSNSPAIDSGAVQAPLDEDGTRKDIGALTYDVNYPVGNSYCAAVENSTGERARILVSGTARVAQNNLGLSVINAPANTVSLFFIGSQEIYVPFGDGFLCNGGQVGRLGVIVTNGNGVADLAFDNTVNLGGAPPVLAGQVRNFQNWYRDTQAAGTGFNYSNAVAVPFVD